MAEENGIRREALIKAIDKVINQVDEGIKKSTLVIPRGYRLKRTVVDRLRNKHLWDARNIMDELDLIANKQSKLPAEERKYLKEIMKSAVGELITSSINQETKEEPKDGEVQAVQESV